MKDAIFITLISAVLISIVTASAGAILGLTGVISASIAGTMMVYGFVANFVLLISAVTFAN